MSKLITVFSQGDVPTAIQLSYTIETTENIQTIFCSIDAQDHPFWLQVRKFELLSQKDQHGYIPLFNEINSSRNMATTLFIDKVYCDIMLAEKLKILTLFV
ncbi:MAG TPA: hypothetical protein VN721_09550 [Flavipsychrobacter sp.]|nr:hypothetical protein [Flavipsychrobacter sp.]